MKPLFLEIAGLNSFRKKQEIDFSKLTDTGVFGIFGPTGSGKSTILDAITLALYGEVERASNNTQGIVNNNENQAEVSFTFQLGTGEQQKKYCVQRSYASVEGKESVRNKLSRLIYYDGENPVVIAENAQNVTNQVQEILGLTAADFKRAVVLPQGKFAEFLRLGGKDRGAMLERLFNLEQYGVHLSSRLKDKIELNRLKLEKTQGEQQGLGDASVAAVKQLEDKLTQAVQQETQVANQLNQLQEQFQEISNLWNLLLEEKQLNQQLNEVLQDKETVKQLTHKYKRAQEAETLRPYLEHLTQSLSLVTVAQEQLTAASENYTHGKSIMEKNEIEYQTAMEVRKEREVKLYTKQELLGQAIELAEEIKQMQLIFTETKNQEKNIQESCKKLHHIIAEKNDELISDQQKRNQLQKKQNHMTIPHQRRNLIYEGCNLYQIVQNKQVTREEMSTKQKKWQDELQVITNRLKQLTEDKQVVYQETQRLVDQEKELEQQKPMSDKQLLEQWQAICSQEENIKQLIRLEQELLEVLEQHSSLQREKENKTEAYQQLMKQVESSKEQYSQMEVAKSVIEDEIKKTEKTYLISQLSAELTAGNPCPVCGCIHHSESPVKMTAEAVQQKQQLDDQLVEIKLKLDTAKQSLNELEKHLITLQLNLNNMENMEQELTEKLDRLTNQVDTNRQQLDGEQVTWPAEKLIKNITCLKEEFAQQQNNAEKWDEAKLLLEKRIKTQEDIIITIEKEETQLLARKDNVDNSMAEIQLSMGELDEQLINDNKQLDEISIQLNIEETHVLTLEKKRLDQWDQEVQQLTDELEKLDKQMTDKENLLKQSVEELTELEKQLAVVSTRVVEQESQLDEKKEKLRNKAGEEGDLAEALNRVKEELNQIIARAEGAEKAKEAADKHFASLKEDLAMAKMRYSEEQKRLNKNQQQLADKLRETQFATWQEAEGALVAKNKLIEIEKYCSDYEEQLKNIKSQLARLEQQISHRQLTKEEWHDWQEKIKTSEQMAKKSLENRAALQRELEQLRERHERYEALAQQIGELQSEGGQLKELQSLLKGNSFVKFIASEKLNLIAQDASRRLGELTGNKYGLEINADDAFVIRDNKNGSIRRPVHTLSGGETFLTSLALALALSGQIQLKGQVPLEFFFLDEGFGTLDPELLETVMCSLERLHLEHLIIGVISHVPELKARLARKLIVSPADVTGIGSTVAVEIS